MYLYISTCISRVNCNVNVHIPVQAINCVGEAADSLGVFGNKRLNLIFCTVASTTHDVTSWCPQIPRCTLTNEFVTSKRTHFIDYMHIVHGNTVNSTREYIFCSNIHGKNWEVTQLKTLFSSLGLFKPADDAKSASVLDRILVLKLSMWVIPFCDLILLHLFTPSHCLRVVGTTQTTNVVTSENTKMRSYILS